MSGYLISEIFFFVYFYKNLKILYKEIETINFALYKIELATLDLVSFYIFKNVLILYSYMTDANSQFN